MAHLGLSEINETSVLDFLKFLKEKRTQNLKSVETVFSEVAESRLVDETFTSDEVKEMLDGVCAVLKADVESDLLHYSHTSGLLLRQLLKQAEHWHLKLKVDLSELESGELLGQIAKFEQEELSSLPASSLRPRQLDPINTSGGEKLLHLEIERLKEDNSKLQSRIRTLEAKATSALSARDQLQKDMQSEETTAPQDDQAHLHQTIARLQSELNQAKKSSLESPVGGDTALTKELEITSHKLLKVSAELEETKKQLEKKFSETTQYINMRKMMESKTATIQSLRSELKKAQESKSK